MAREAVRSFIAFDITEQAILARIGEIQRSLLATGASLTLVRPENVHVTVRFLGEVSPSLLGSVGEAMDEVAFDPFEVEFRGLGAFPSPRRARVLWVGIARGASELAAIFGQLEPKLRELGFPPDRRGFVPHLTIARARAPTHQAGLARLVEQAADLEVGKMLADRLKLKRSVLTPKGPIYSSLHETPARGAT